MLAGNKRILRHRLLPGHLGIQCPPNLEPAVLDEDFRGRCGRRESHRAGQAEEAGKPLENTKDG